YRPGNAILVVAGKVKTDEIKLLAEKWFGDIPSGEKYFRNTPQEPKQQEARLLEITADVPLDAFIKTWHMGARLDKEYYIADLISEILGGGASSRMYQSLVKEKQLFSNIECSHYGTVEAGLLAVEGKLVKGISMIDAEKAVNEEIEKIKLQLVTETELQKVKNKTESVIAFEDMSVMNRANSLAFYELLGDATLMNTELERYNAVTATDILNYGKELFDEKNSNTIHYYSKNKN
ncbi:MAG TPA: insulinase family protein, partial [Chitinophagaceae bacterium]|nr:insulinase family protein [Chitinophagaceae bacterium]